MPPLLLKLVFSRMAPGKVPMWVRPIVKMIAKRAQQSVIDPQLAIHIGYWEGELAKASWSPEVNSRPPIFK